MYVQQQTLPCCYVCNCYYYDRAVHISVAVDMRTLLDRNNFSFSSNGQVAAHRATGLIIKRLWRNTSLKVNIRYARRERGFRESRQRCGYDYLCIVRQIKSCPWLSENTLSYRVSMLSQTRHQLLTDWLLHSRGG